LKHPIFNIKSKTARGCVAQLAERRASNRKIAKPWFDFRCGSASLCPWERHLTQSPILGPNSVPLWWPSLTKDIQTEQLLCWSGTTDTEYSTTSGSNKEEVKQLVSNL